MCIRDSFKVAGTHDGITAIQMDIKIHGLTRPIVEEAIARTKEAREYIINEIMTPCIAHPRAEVGKYAPKIISIKIDPEKIGDVDVYKRQILLWISPLRMVSTCRIRSTW